MKAVVLRAERVPALGPIGSSANASSNDRYRHPTIGLEEHALGPLRPEDLRIEVERVGICGSDIGLVDVDAAGWMRTTVPLAIPPDGLVLGHEAIGVVREVGSAVVDHSPGDWVGLESLLSCGLCPSCRRGRFNQCVQARLIGFQRDGLFRTVADVPARLAHPIGDLARSEQGRRAAACLEPAACALLALSSASLQPAERVLIFGAGPIGLFSAMLAREVFRARHVVIVEPLPARRALAGPWADELLTVQSFTEAPADVLHDVLIEASGDLAMVNRAIPRLAANGRVVLLARGEASLTIDHVGHLITQAIAILGSRGHLGGAFHQVLELYRRGLLPLDAAVTGVTNGLDSILCCMNDPATLIGSHCKLQVTL